MSPSLTAAEKDEGTSNTTAQQSGNVGRESPALEAEESTLNEKDNEHSDGSVKATTEEEDEYVYLTGSKLTIVMVGITLVCFLLMLDMSIVVTAIPRITSDFHSLDDVGWYGSAYLIANCALQPLTGKMYTYFSSKWLFIGFLCLFELGSLLCGVARDSDMLIVGRAVAGLGSSGLMNGAMTIIHASVPIHKVPLFTGMLMGFGQLGILFGPLIGGALTQYTTWRWCFYINLPAGAPVVALLALTTIPDRTVKSVVKQTLYEKIAQLDILGFLLFAPAAIQFLLALEWGGVKFAWSAATIIGLFCGSAGTLAVFLGWEYHMGDRAMIPFSMVRRRIVWCSCLFIGFFMGSMLMTTYYLPIYFQAVRNATPTLSGVYLLPGILGTMIFAVTSGAMISKIGYYLPWAVTSGSLTAISNGLIATFTPHTSTAKWIGYQLLGGAGRGMGFQMPIVAVQNDVPKEQVSIATSLVVFSQTFGGALFLTFGQTIFNEGLKKGLHKYAPNVSAELVIRTGATAIEDVVSGKDYTGVLEAYNYAIQHCFYLAAGASVASFVFAWGIGFKNIKKPKVVEPEV